MTQVELSTFLAIVKYGSISLAAEKLYITQPAISRRLLSLENELGYALLERRKGKRAMELTPEGREFISVAQRWLSVWKDAKSIPGIGRKPELTVILNPCMGSHVPLAIDDFIKNHPEICFKFHVYHSLEAYQWMEYGKADLALISKPLNSSVVHTIPMYKEDMTLLTRGAFVQPQPLHPSQLNVSQELMVPWTPDFQDWHDYWFGVGSSPKVFGDTPLTMKYFYAAERNWWSVVPASFVGEITSYEGVQKADLMDTPPELVIYYLTNKEHLSSLAEDFLCSMDKCARRIKGILSCMNYGVQRADPEV